MPDLATLLGHEGSILEEQIILAQTNVQRVSILSAFLYKRLICNPDQPSAVSAIIGQVLHTSGTASVQKLAGQCFLSVRQFERKFKEFSGFSPKLFTRITRFQAALQLYPNPGKTLTEIAYDCGYYDQSHFINDFKEFSGYHPKHYFSGKAEGIAWRE
jgi:AraC-like DNA-binding protein